MKDSFKDDPNLNVLLSRIGIIAFNKLSQHIKSFKYTPIGASQLIIDMSEYRKMSHTFNSKKVVMLFEHLIELCSALLVVGPDNVKGIIQSERMAMYDKLTISEFMKLRCD